MMKICRRIKLAATLPGIRSHSDFSPEHFCLCRVTVRQIIISAGRWFVESLLLPPCYHQSEWITVVQPTRNVSYTAPTNKTLTSNPHTRVSGMTTHTHPVFFSLLDDIPSQFTYRVRDNVGHGKWTRSWLLPSSTLAVTTWEPLPALFIWCHTKSNLS